MMNHFPFSTLKLVIFRLFNIYQHDACQLVKDHHVWKDKNVLALTV